MKTVTLHRASRIVEAIQAELKASEPLASAKLSIFAANAADAVAALVTKHEQAVERYVRLLQIRAKIKAAVGRVSATSGVSELLSEKASLDALIALMGRLPGVLPERPQEPEDPYEYRRRRKTPAAPTLGQSEVVAAVEAMQGRYKEANTEVGSEVVFCPVTDEAVGKYRTALVEARRNLDDVSGRLRKLNDDNTIDVDDADMDWLITNSVI